MTAWQWVAKAVVLAIHEEQLAEHGGAAGLRDQGLLDSALSRPLNLAAYDDGADAADLAAAYASGILRNHPFVDGNKRTATIVALIFLAENGFELAADDPSLLEMILGAAEGSQSDENLASWFRRHLRPV